MAAMNDPLAAPAAAAGPSRYVPGSGETHRHVVVVIVNDRPGVLNRVASLARARKLAPDISRLAPPDGVAAGGVHPRFAVWLEPDPALGLVARLRSGLEHFPLAFPEDVQRWRDWETVLGPVARCERATLWSGTAPDAFRIRLSGCGE